MAGIAEDWKRYTIRDRILLCSSILPLFISVLYMLFYFPGLRNIIFGHWDEGSFTLDLGKYLFWGDSDWSSLFITFDVETYTFYIIRPIWLLLSFLSLGLYGFVLSKSDEEVTELLKQKPETAVNEGPAALSRTSIFMAVTAVSQLLIFFCLFIGGYLMHWEHYFYIDDTPFVLFKGYISSDTRYDWMDATVNPLTYLYIPNLIATVALAFYTRIKNTEMTPEYPGTEEAPEIQSFGISAYGAGKLKEAKDLLDSGVITEEEFQQIKDEYM